MKNELSLRQLWEASSSQREKIQFAVNRETLPYRLGDSFYAPIGFPSPSRSSFADRSVFRQNALEKQAAKEAKWAYKEQMKAHYGADWKKHNNVPSNAI